MPCARTAASLSTTPPLSAGAVVEYAALPVDDDDPGSSTPAVVVPAAGCSKARCCRERLGDRRPARRAITTARPWIPRTTFLVPNIVALPFARLGNLRSVSRHDLLPETLVANGDVGRERGSNCCTCKGGRGGRGFYDRRISRQIHCLGVELSGCEKPCLYVKSFQHDRPCCARILVLNYTFVGSVRLHTRISLRGSSQSNLKDPFYGTSPTHDNCCVRNCGRTVSETDQLNNGRVVLQAQPHRGAHPTRSRGGRPFARRLPSGHEGPADDQQPPVATGERRK